VHDPVEKSSVAESVFRDLRGKILAGSYAPGEALPGERALSKSLGVNRGAVRESLKRLAQSGLVEIQHGEHTRVTDFRRTGTLDLLGELIVLPGGRVDLEVARSLLLLALSSRIAALRLATQRGDEVGPLLMAQLEKIRAAGDDLAAAMTARISFWETLFYGSGEQAHRMLWNSFRKVVRPLMGLFEQVAPVAGGQVIFSDVARLVAEGDPDAAERAMRKLDDQYIGPILDRLSAQIQSGQTLIMPEPTARA
jgi:DNA-binding FadR family transcriptional regulator